MMCFAFSVEHRGKILGENGFMMGNHRFYFLSGNKKWSMDRGVQLAVSAVGNRCLIFQVIERRNR